MNMFSMNSKYDRALQEEIRITKDMLKMSIDQQLILYNLQNRVKSKRSYRRKIKTYMVRYHISQIVAMNKIHDLIRYTILIPDSDTMALSDTVTLVGDYLNTLDYQFVEARNYFLYPKKSGYQGYHLYYKSPGGIIFEIQLHTKQSMHHKEKTHGHYKKNTTLKKRKV